MRLEAGGLTVLLVNLLLIWLVSDRLVYPILVQHAGSMYQYYLRYKFLIIFLTSLLSLPRHLLSRKSTQAEHRVRIEAVLSSTS